MLKIYKSSAGSGKTYTLVKEYLKLVLSHPSDYKNILAITFTNKATVEMKTRIVDALIALSDGGLEHLANDLKKDGLTADIPANAKKVLENIFHDYSSFAVQTIDGFFQKIVRALAYELRLSLRFDIELDQQQVINTISDHLLLEVGLNANVTDWLSKLLLVKINEDRGWNIDFDLQKIAKELFREELNDRIDFVNDDALKALANELKAIKEHFEKNMKSFAQEAFQVMEFNGFTVTDFAYGKAGVANYFNKITYPVKPLDYEPGKRVIDAFEDTEKWTTKTSSVRNRIIECVEGVEGRKGLQEILMNCIDYYTNHFEAYISALETHKLIYIYGLLSHLKEKLKQYRDENNIVFLSDTNKLLSVINADNDTPFVYEKIGNRFKHLLIDEFQDTSDFQWNNLLPLINNSLANGYNAIIVGDAKQSIYRWRGGNMKLLLNGVADSLSHFKEVISEYSLNTNFRSKDYVVRFNNQFFKTASKIIAEECNLVADDWFHKAYSIEDLHQHTSEKNLEGGYVKIQFLEDQKETEETAAQKWKETALENTLAIIKQCEQDGYRMRDIAILVRRNTEGNEIARYLFDNGYTRVISSDSLLLYKAPQVQFILNIYRYLNDRHDRIAAAEIFYYYTNILNDVYPVLHELFSSINQNKQVFKEELPSEFAMYMSYLNTLPLYEMTEQIIEVFGLNKMPDAYIQRFQDLILDYLDKNKGDLQSFIDWWEENQESDKCSLVVPENEDAITIMTIHKSKGLQFPIVLIPLADWDLKPKSNSVLWVSSNEEPFNQSPIFPVNSTKILEKSYFKDFYSQEIIKNYIDNLNLLYVAFTRPEDRLYIFCKQTKESEKLSSASKLIANILSSDNTNEWIFNPEENSYETGIVIKNGYVDISSMNEENLILTKLASYPYSRWQSKITISPKAKAFWELFDNEKTRKINYGILVHRVLAEIITTDDIDSSITKIILQGLVSKEESEILKQNIIDLLSLKEIEYWFNTDWTVKTESEILLPDGTTLRPDRVLLKENNAIIIDYKTGKEEPKHADQVNHYASVLEDLGYSTIHKYLFYLNEKRVVSL